MTSFSTLSHSSLDICSPIPWPVYRELLSAGAVKAQPKILDIGCGKGGILAKTVELFDGTGTGVDLKDSLANHPTLAARQLEEAGKIKFVFEDARVFLEKQTARFDLIICIGSSHAVGGVEQLFNLAKPHLATEGQLLLGELVWKSKPDPDFLNFLGGTEEDQMYSSQLLQLAQQNGWRVNKSVSGTDEDFETYEMTLRKNILDWCKKNAANPLASEFTARSNSWCEAREKWARHAFGFELLLLGADSIRIR